MMPETRLTFGSSGLAALLACTALACTCKSPGVATKTHATQNSSGAQATVIAAADVCTHMDKLLEKEGRQPSGQCGRTMPVTQQLDGPELWSLRAGCMLKSTRLAEAYRCNKKHHPNWPSPNGRYEGPSPLPRDDELPKASSLCEAASRGDLAAVEEFLKDAAQRKTLCPDKLGVGAQIDALTAASVFGELQIVRVLVEKGFDPLKPDTTGRSAYVWAASGNHIDVVDYFWKQGVRPPAKDPFIGTVLYSAALWGRLGVLEHYLAQSADLDARHYGYTPVMGAAQGGHLEVAKWLVSHGANPKGALELARRFGHEDVAKYLESAASDSGVAP